MNSSGPIDWRWGWAVLFVALCLFGLATIEPETSEAVNSTIAIGAIGCVLWVIWQMMQHDQ